MAFFGTTARGRRASANLTSRSRPSVEALELRLTPYALSGGAWIKPELITLSFVPDGTTIGTASNGSAIASNLQSSFDAKFGSTSVWQNQILKAAQTWAQQTNINFKVVADNGAAIGSLANQQGDGNVGDIRFGGYNFGNTILAQAYLPSDDNNTDFAGDIQINTGQTWNVGSQYDLYTVALHEIGHALGLYHGASGSVMYGTYPGVVTTLATDDINGIRAVTGWTNGTYTSPGYGGARANDGYDTGAGNGTSATATDLTASIGSTTKTALIQNLDLTTTADVDYYKFTVPTGMGGSLTVKAVSSGLSLLAPALTLYNSSQTQLATQSGLNQYGTTVSVMYTVTAGQTYYVKVTGADATAFGTGKYALTLALAGVASPTVPLPNTTVANDPNPNAGGGQPIKISYESQVNSYATGAQTTQAESAQAIAADALGNYVVVWSSSGQDGSGYGVYAQRYTVLGTKIGEEFRVNTTTAGDQMHASVAMDGVGDFVVTWSSKGQDNGTSWGVYAQRFNFLGAAVGGEFRVNTTTADDQKHSSVAMDVTGNFVVTWSSYKQDTGTSWGIYAQRYNANGEAQGSEFRVNMTTAYDQEYSNVAMDAAGNFVVVWSSENQDTATSMGIYARRFNAAGVAQNSEFRVNTTTAGDQDYAAVAMNAAGAFVVTWSSSGQDGSGHGVYAQRYDLIGGARGGEILVNTTTAGDQMYSRVTLDAFANFMVTWSSYGQDAASTWGVYARPFSSSGIAQGGEFLVNTTTAGSQRFSSLAMNGLGTTTIVWSGQGNGDADGIYFQRYQLLNALNPMKAPQPHGFAPDGCCCASCVGTAVAQVRRDGYGTLPPRRDTLGDLVGLLQRRPGATRFDRD